MNKTTVTSAGICCLILMMSSAPSQGGQQEFGIQACLKARGFDPGPLDGLPGKKTAAAIQAYQDSRDIPESTNLSEQDVEVLCDGVDISKFQMVRQPTELNRSRTNGGETLTVSLWQGEPPSDAPGTQTFVFGSNGLIARSAAPGVHVSGKVMINKGEVLRAASFPDVMDERGNELALTITFNSISGEFDLYVPPEHTSRLLRLRVTPFDAVEFRPANLPKKENNR